jgi:hypothetical protein
VTGKNFIEFYYIMGCREKAIFRECETCGTRTTQWHIHHKNEDHFDNRKHNLMCLCEDCHRAIHHSSVAKAREGIDGYCGVTNAQEVRTYDAYDDMSESRIGTRIAAGFYLMGSDD